jgi:hypothetical protein
MRKDWIVNKGSADEARFRFTATRVRREVLVDVPMGQQEDGYHYHRMRFTLQEAETFLSLILEAVVAARS